ncbi:MAG: PilZ domain-containing protein [Ignavibacteriales bacterium]
MNIQRKETRLETQLSSSIKGIDEIKRHFCIIRNVSKKGVFLTAKTPFVIGQTVECIIAFEDKRITFVGDVRRVGQNELGVEGYGIEIIEISEADDKILEEFIDAGYLPLVNDMNAYKHIE